MSELFFLARKVDILIIERKILIVAPLFKIWSRIFMAYSRSFYSMPFIAMLLILDITVALRQQFCKEGCKNKNDLVLEPASCSH